MSKPADMAVLEQMINDAEFRAKLFASPEHELKHRFPNPGDLQAAIAFVNLVKGSGNIEDALVQLKTLHTTCQ